MATWAVMISAGVAVWVKKALAGLGVGLITYVGLSAIKSKVDSVAASAWGSIPGDIYQLMAIAGFVDSVNIWLSAFASAIAILSFKHYGVLTQ